MSKIKINLEGVGNVELTDRDYIGSGGEASIYKFQNLAVKLYHDSAKSVPRSKITELSQIASDHVLVPKCIAYGSNGNIAGYAMRFVDGCEPLCKLFTKTFKSNNGIQIPDLTELVKSMRTEIESVHQARCLIVDLNEMNVMVDGSKRFIEPFLIDTDSFQSPSHRATAIMDSIRDRLVQHNQWTELSDWYSYAILCFQLYIGVHPYKGTHPKYKPSEWQKRMDDGISAFDKHVSLPSICNDLSVIPSRYLDWMKLLFVQNGRDVPPNIDKFVAVAVTIKPVMIKADDAYLYTLVETFTDEVRDMFDVFGVLHFVTKHGIFKGARKVIGFDDVKVLCTVTDGKQIVYAIPKHDSVEIHDYTGKLLDSLVCKQSNVMNGCLYIQLRSKLLKLELTELASKTVVTTTVAANIMEWSTKFFEGVVAQEVLGTAWVIFPVMRGVQTVKLPELIGYRVLNMKKIKNLLVVMAEKAGQYDKLLFLFEDSSNVYSFRRIDNVVYNDINFAVLENGIHISVNDNGSIELFKSLRKIKTVDNTVFNCGHPIRSFNNKVYVNFNNKVYSATTK